ncbi:MAG: CaiB/BaiF CoA-transferase family protein [Thermoproteus sp.]
MEKYRVVELAQLYPGPLAGRLLAGWGFEVVKIEPPGGDPMRHYIPSLFEALNAGKYSVVLDLKREEDRKKLYRIVEGARAVISSFRRASAERLGVSYEALSSINPNLLYVAITSYKDSDLPGHDLNFAAVAGLLEGRPIVPQCVDVASGLMAAFAVAAAVATGRSGYVEVPMESAAYMLNLLNFAQLRDRGDVLLTGRYPFYNVYGCRGGKVALGAVEEKFWRRFCELIGRRDLEGRMYDPSAVGEVEREVSAKDCKELLHRAEELDVPLSEMRDLLEASRCVDLQDLVAPLFLKGGRAPRLGEHNALFEV